MPWRYWGKPTKSCSAAPAVPTFIPTPKFNPTEMFIPAGLLPRAKAISRRTGSMSTQVVLITGGLTGIGRAAAVAFAKKGAKVVVSGRRDGAGKALLEELGHFARQP